ncbi:hypothetical protein DYB28_010856, partial [Aphanomyces astaci]
GRFGRVVVTSDNIPDLLQLTRCLPQFAWHRQDWAILRPFTRGTSAEVADLCASGVYIAGMLHSDLHPTTTTSSPLLYDSIQSAALTSVRGLDEPLKWAVAVAEELV